MKTRLVAGLLAACAIAASATPAFGDPDGTVSARVSVAAPCIELGRSQLDFGVLGLSDDTNGANPVASPQVPVPVTNCSGANAFILVRGTEATSGAGTTWTHDDLLPICPDKNRYLQRLNFGFASMRLTTTNQSPTLNRLPPGPVNVAFGINAWIQMPCSGSNGGGEVMNFSYIFTAML